MAERLALPTSDHGVAGSNPAGGEILPEPKRRFIAQSLSCSPFHRLEMTEILLKGRKTLTHPSIYVWLPDRLCSSPPLLGFYWNRWGGETALPQASMSTIYKQHLYNMTPYTLKYGPGLGKTLFPVLGDNRTLRMRQPDH